MLWILLFAIFLLLILVILKLWELKRGQPTGLSKIIASQDTKLEHLGSNIQAHFLISVHKIKFFFSKLVPFYFLLILRNVVTKIFRFVGRMKDDIRGKFEIKKDKLSSSSFLQEIAKIKEQQESRKKLRETEDF